MRACRARGAPSLSWERRPISTRPFPHPPPHLCSVFKLEQAEYERERIDWSNIDFPDNQDILDLIEAKRPTGVLALLDEQCLLASATDDGFASKCYAAYKDHGRFSASNKQRAAGRFAVRHYAGEVEYTVAGFIEKNRDSIHREALELMAASDIRMVRAFFAPQQQWAAEAAAAAAEAAAAAAEAAEPLA